MNKQTHTHVRGLLTTLGIIFAFLIVFGGWWLTNNLLDKQETAMLSTVGSVKVTAPIDQPVSSGSETNYPTLTDSEIYMVLNVWEADVDETPHDPKTGQLNMEQAIDAGKSWLAYFSEHLIIPSELTVYDKTNAYLCEINMIADTQLIKTPLEFRQDDTRSKEELKPFYSYWTVSFSSEDFNATLIINAATG